MRQSQVGGTNDMSATTTQLLDEIKNLELQLLDARAANDSTRIMYLENLLQDSRKRLVKANDLLTENRSILKG